MAEQTSHICVFMCDTEVGLWEQQTVVTKLKKKIKKILQKGHGVRSLVELVRQLTSADGKEDT